MVDLSIVMLVYQRLKWMIWGTHFWTSPDGFDTQEALRDVLQRFPSLTLELEVLPELLATHGPKEKQPRPGKEIRHAFSLLRLMRPRRLHSAGVSLRKRMWKSSSWRFWYVSRTSVNHHRFWFQYLNFWSLCVVYMYVIVCVCVYIYRLYTYLDHSTYIYTHTYACYIYNMICLYI